MKPAYSSPANTPCYERLRKRENAMTIAFPMFLAISVLMQQTSGAPDRALAMEREQLAAIEAASHQSWHRGDTDALAELMAPEFHFVVMNGALETRAEILGEDIRPEDRVPSPLQVRNLRVEPERVLIRGATAAVISILHIDATARGRQVPPQMRILSVFTREGEGWTLLARSITPMQQPAIQP
jgi:ketosteroid isomerase-like protein